MATRVRVARTWKHCDRTTRQQKVEAIALTYALYRLESSRVTKLQVAARSARILNVSWRSMERVLHTLAPEEDVRVKKFVDLFTASTELIYA